MGFTSKTSCLFLALAALAVSAGLCEETGFVFGENASYPLENCSISTPSATDMVTFTTAGGQTVCSSSREVGWLQEAFDYRVESDNPLVRGYTKRLAMIPGLCTIEQINRIYDNLTASWKYFGDPRCQDYYQYANETLQEGYTGDCDDFAILMASMVESIGGTARVILAHGPGGGHAYAEVYLGRKDADKNVEQIINWLKRRHNKKEIFTHCNDSTEDVWLNLDWGEDIKKAAYPGAPIFRAKAEEHIPVYIKSAAPKTLLSPSPLALFTYRLPGGPYPGETVTFDASESRKVCEIKEYYWEFGDGSTLATKNSSVDHIYSQGGLFRIRLTVAGIQGFNSSASSKDIKINKLPIANFTFIPENPTVEEIVDFNGNLNIDEKIKTLKWDFGDADKKEGLENLSTEHVYKNSGTFNVTLEITDEQGAKGIFFKNITVSPVGEFEVRSSIATGNFSWNPQNFRGFYYSEDDDIGRESLSANITDGRKLSGDFPYGLRYETTAQKKIFKFKEWGCYDIIAFMGEKYFAGYGNETEFVDESLFSSSMANGYLHKILIDDTREIIVDKGIPLPLMEGYELSIRGISEDCLVVYLDLFKDGKKVDSQIKAISRGNLRAIDQTYVYKKDIEDLKGLATIVIHIKNIYRYKDEAAILVDGIWQISEHPTEIEENMEFDKMNIAAVDSYGIRAFNKDNNITLSKNRNIRIMENIGIKTADNDTLRYSLYKVVTARAPGIWEIWGSIATGDSKWTPQSFHGFYYDIDDDTGGESLTTRITDGRMLSGYPPYGVTYETIAQEQRFKFKDWGSYKMLPFLGEAYFLRYMPGKTDISNLFYEMSKRNESSAYILEKILKDDNINQVIVTNESLVLEEGYELAIKSVDFDGNKVYLQLRKGGQIIDHKIITPSVSYAISSTKKSGSAKDGTFIYKKKIGEKKVELIKVHFNQAFRTMEKELATVDHILQVSETNPSQEITNSSDERFLSSNESLKLEEGYELAFKSMDVDGNKIYLELSKDGVVVESQVIAPPNDIETFIYRKKIGEKEVECIKVHTKNAFRGINESFATVDLIWQVSEADPSRDMINSSDEILFRSNESLKLEEGYELALKSVDIDGNKIYLELSKDGVVVDFQMIVAPKEADETFIYRKKFGEKEVELIKAHIKKAYRSDNESLATLDRICQLSETDPSREIINSSDERILSSNESLKLEEGYELALKSMDVDGNKIYLELSKNGVVVDSKILYPKVVSKTYYYKKPLGDYKDLVTIAVHFESAFRGTTAVAAIDGIWQISDNPWQVQVDQQYDKMRIASIDPIAGKIIMDNMDEKINLRRGKEIHLMPGINIKVANSEDLKY